MGFIVRKAQCRLWPVTVRVNVCDETGNVTQAEQTFVGHFDSFTEADHQLVVETVDKLFPAPEDGTPLPRAAILKRNAAYFARLMCGWGPEVADESGAPIPYSDDALAALVTGPDGFAISEALFVAIAEIRFGGAPLKNLLTSAAPGESPCAAGGETTAIAPT